MPHIYKLYLLNNITKCILFTSAHNRLTLRQHYMNMPIEYLLWWNVAGATNVYIL